MLAVYVQTRPLFMLSVRDKCANGNRVFLLARINSLLIDTRRYSTTPRGILFPVAPTTANQRLKSTIYLLGDDDQFSLVLSGVQRRRKWLCLTIKLKYAKVPDANQTKLFSIYRLKNAAGINFWLHIKPAFTLAAFSYSVSLVLNLSCHNSFLPVRGSI